MPRGTVKWFDQAKGFGFLAGDDGRELYVHASALPDGPEGLEPGRRVEFSIVESARRAKAWHVTLLPEKTIARVRRSPDELASLVQDLAQVLDRVESSLRRGRHLDPTAAGRVAALLVATAGELTGAPPGCACQAAVSAGGGAPARARGDARSAAAAADAARAAAPDATAPR